MSRYLVTGATGYIGSMLVKNLINENITVIVRNKLKAAKMLPQNIHIIEADLTDSDSLEKVDCEYDYIIHCASITKSSEMINNPLEVTQSIVNATQNVMDLTVRCHAKSVIYISSMEIYGDIDCTDGHLVEEHELGQVDLLSARSCYPLAKRMAENICYCYYLEHHLPIKIVRLAQVFGKGVLENETRVFAQFAKCVIEKRDIVLHTLGKSYGNYCESEDAINAILLILEKGKNGEAYNVANEDCTMMISQMAQFVAGEIAHNQITVKWEVPSENVYGYAADTGLRLSSQKLRSLGWKPQKGMLEMYEDLINDERKWIKKSKC